MCSDPTRMVIRLAGVILRDPLPLQFSVDWMDSGLGPTVEPRQFPAEAAV
jgi:hypothetical protein